MNRRPTLILLLLAAGCGTTWQPIDADGDGYTRQDGDCWDAIEGPAGLAGSEINPDASETWYDGIDQDCDGGDDYDQDGDGWVPDDMGGLTTQGVAGSGLLPVGDCWDEAAGPESSELAGADIHPAATEAWYDGVDQDCDGASDYDADLDGHDHADHGGTDCDDDDAAINPDASEDWYDGVDQDCDGNDDDQDEDGWGVNEDCDDDDPAIFPDPSIPELWYNGIDENCDANDGDQDGDGYWAEDYAGLVASSGSGEDPLEVPSGFEDDCDDLADSVNPGASETWYDGVDQDCDGASDYDADADGYDSSDHSGGDCDDSDNSINPEALESYYDGVDQDCDGLSDYDADADGHDSSDHGGGDCADLDPTIGPHASEVFYDGVDQDCDGLSDYDADYDGHDAIDFGGDDCEDSDASISPSTPETWYDGVDQDCDGLSDYDADYDGYDSSDYGGDDCDDARDDVYTGAAEAWDGADNDCNGLLDDMLAADVALGWLDAQSAGEQLGFAGALSYGDIDGDGSVDLLVGSTTANSATGTVWAVDAHNPSALHDAAANRANPTLFGVDPDGFMAVMGPQQADVTGDGVDDLAIGGTDAVDGSNCALALYAGGSSLTGELTSSSAYLELTGATGAEAPVILSHLDMDADGVAELVYADWSGQSSWGYLGGEVSLVQPAGLSGSTDISSVATSNLLSWDDVEDLGRVMGGGDLDGDGYDDLAVGAPGYAGGDGLVAIYRGSSPLPSWGWNSYEDYADFTILGDSASALGSSGSPQICDLDGDTAPDLVVSDPGADRVYVFLAAGALLGSYTIDQADIVISGEIGSLFGAAVRAADTSGDGVDDLLIGAPGSDEPDAPASSWDGALYVLDGLVISAGASADTTQATATLLPSHANLLGAAIIATDLDADGFIDPVTAAPSYDGMGRIWLLPSP